MAKVEVRIRRTGLGHHAYSAHVDFGQGCVVTEVFTERQYRRGKHMEWVGKALHAGSPGLIQKHTIEY